MKRELFLCGFMIMGGCSTFQTDPQATISIVDVQEQVECELQNALKTNFEKHRWLDKWVASYELSIYVEDSGTTGVGFGYSVPVGTDKFGFGTSATLNNTAKRNMKIKRSVRLAAVRTKFKCEALKMGGYDLSGNLGLETWLNAALNPKGKDDRLRTSPKRDQELFADEPTGLGYTVEFDVKLTAGLNPSFAFTLITSGANLGIEGYRARQNTVDIAFTSLPDPGPLHVFVENFPGQAPPLRKLAPERPSSQQKPASDSGRATSSKVPESAQFKLDGILNSLQADRLFRSNPRIR